MARIGRSSPKSIESVQRPFVTPGFVRFLGLTALLALLSYLGPTFGLR